MKSCLQRATSFVRIIGKVNIFYTPDILEDPFLSEEESAHCLRVLRMKAGDILRLTDGKGHFYDARISEAHPKRCAVELLAEYSQGPDSAGLYVAVAPTKNMDRMEWMVEKLTEMGIDGISFLNCRYSERKVMKTERLQKIAVSAMKQSERATLPQIAEMVDFKSFIRQDFEGQKFICHCYRDLGERLLLKEQYRMGGKALVLIGPEGDFSQEEVKMAMTEHYLPVSLGSMRLRTETAAMVSGLTMKLINIHS